MSIEQEMNTNGLDHAVQMVEERFLQFPSFGNQYLSDLRLSPVHHVDTPDGGRATYTVAGNICARRVAIALTPYSTRITDDSQRVRLAAQQRAVGEDVCVVGVQAYDPANAKLSKEQRRIVAKGSFAPYVERVLTVVEVLQLSDDQSVGFYGFSKGADVSTETVYAIANDRNKGIRSYDGLAAIEPARTVRRGRLAMLRAFAGSGGDLFDNVVASDSPALLEARDIDLVYDHKAEKHHASEVKKGVAQYSLQDLPGNFANLGGFRTDTTLQQINEMVRLGILPPTLVGRMTESTVCHPSFIGQLQESRNLTPFEASGDHSLADNIRMSAAFMLYATSLWDQERV